MAYLPADTGSASALARVWQTLNRLHPSRRRWLNHSVEPGGTQRESSEYVELLEKLEAAQETDVVEQALVAARERLGMDAAYVTTIDPQHQRIHAVVGVQEAVAKYQDSTLPIEQTFCIRMLNGEIPNVVPDTRAQPALRDLPATREFGAYVGVPVTLADGRVHGTLCCVSRATKSGMGADELRFMQTLAGIVAARVDQVRGDLVRLTERFRSAQPTA
jgi:GAF domain-containing protein